MYGSAYLRDIRLQNLSDRDFYLSRSLIVICDSVIRLPVHGFPFLFNSNIWPILANLRDISLQNLSGLDFKMSRSLRSNVDINALHIFAFLFMLNSIIWLTTLPVHDIWLRNLSDLDFDLSRSKSNGMVSI